MPVQNKTNLRPVNKRTWILLTPTVVYWCIVHVIKIKDINRSKKTEAKATSPATNYCLLCDLVGHDHKIGHTSVLILKQVLKKNVTI